jgi:hypothetical protein
VTTSAPHVDDQAAARAAAPVRALAGAAVFSDAPEGLATLWGELLGIDFEPRLHPDGREHHIATVGGLQLEIKATLREDGTPTPDALDFRGPHSNVELSFTVDDAAAAQALAVELGFRVHAPVEQHGWGAFGTVLDPEGNRLGLFTPPTGSHS